MIRQESQEVDRQGSYFSNHVAQEAMQVDTKDVDPLERVLGTVQMVPPRPSLRGASTRFYIETVYLSNDGALFLVGWADDRHDKLSAVECESEHQHRIFDASCFAREARADLTHIAGGSAAALGLWCFSSASGLRLAEDRLVTVRLRTDGGQVLLQTVRAQATSRPAFRTALLTYDLGSARPASTQEAESCRAEAAQYLAAFDLDTQDDHPQSGTVGFDPTDAVVTNQIIHTNAGGGPAPGGALTSPRCGLDAVFACPDGAMLLVGWVDDTEAPLDSVRVNGDGWEAYVPGSAAGRARRTDVEHELGSGKPQPYGFWSLITGRRAISMAETPRVEVTLSNAATSRLNAPTPRIVTAAELRDTALGYFASCNYHGAPHVEAQAQLDGGLGRRIVAFNCAVSRQFTANPYVQRHARLGGNPRASFVVCLYGRCEFLFLQAAAFSRLRSFATDYEMVYVSNSPELSEQLSNEARIAHSVFGVDITLVLLAGNAGFGAANNVAVQHCRTKRIIIANPDVFPEQADWACRHMRLLDDRSAAETRFFGVPLYYDDGSMMHAGMYLELDSGLSWTSAGVTARPMLRVEHYAKGAPARTSRYLASRLVPAVTGAFISIDRTWFETLGGFTEDYVFGHYEDADLCLKSLRQGVPIWLHDAGLLHLEGKGSVRQAPHEGGSIVNRWLFSKTWIDMVKDGMLGPVPSRLSGLAETTDAPAVESSMQLVPQALTAAPSRPQRRARSTTNGTAWREAVMSTLG